MENTNLKKIAQKRRNKKLLLLFIVFGITIIGGVYTTYAWFVGLGNVKVNNFTIELESENYLELSLDGYNWNENITITENTIKAHSAGGSAYAGNTNSWVGEDGLIPVSTSGDNTDGKLDIYSKSSLTGTNGGYGIVANKLDNSETEKNHYVVFDLFVKNKSGDVYNSEYNLGDDENIFLTNSSTITGTASGATSYGIQNSARVAFVQIGRISLDDLVTNTTPVINCTEPEDGDTYTPLCNAYGNSYKTVIWEPNELAHDSKLVTYYNLVCKSRSTNLIYGSGACDDITGGYVPTYTIKTNITSGNRVDIYDGLNGYNNDIQVDQDETEYLLQNTKTFTDTMKATEGHYTLFKLHPHSVTKIRVYVYLEGQDVDNYDLITNDVDIKVTFGFTKERKNTDTLLDEEYKPFVMSIQGQTTVAYAEPDEDSVTWGEWIKATAYDYSDDYFPCNGIVCWCVPTDRIYAGTGVINFVTVSDSDGYIGGSTAIVNGFTFSRAPASRPSGYYPGNVCEEVSVLPIIVIDGTSIMLDDDDPITWEEWINQNVQTNNTTVKCNQYACINKADGKVVAIASYNNGTIATDYLMDPDGYFAEAHSNIKIGNTYTTDN